MESNPSKFIELEEYEDLYYTPSNREKVRRPRKAKFYCDCDFALVGESSKCPICNRRMGRRRNKKE